MIAAWLGGAFVLSTLIAALTVGALAKMTISLLKWRQNQEKLEASDELLKRVAENESKIRQLQMSKLSRRT